MISPLLFAGTYKVNYQDNKDKFPKFRAYALEKELEGGVSTKFSDKATLKNGKYRYEAQQSLIVPDSMNMDVETFCASNGIVYTKVDNEDLPNPKNITSRIAPPPSGYKKVNVDSEKLEKLCKKQMSNIAHCKSDYEKYFSNSTDAMIESGDEFPATTLAITAIGGNEDLKRYVDYYGVDYLNDEQIAIDFCQKTDKPDHCSYFALKELGLKNIPVYVNKDTLEAGKIMGLFEE